MITYGKTDKGKLRKRNEDSFSISEGDDYVSAVVCDGMGGVRGGNVASELAVCVYNDNLFKEIGKTCTELTGQIIKNAMLSAVKAANDAVIKRADTSDQLYGMGTTLVACFMWQGKAFVVNVGDSRLYRILDGKPIQVTKDHSFVQFLIDNGRITETEAATHPNRNVITKALGVASKVEPDFFVVDELDGVLLCSDGLINYLSPEQMEEIIASDNTVKKKTNSLISAANKGGGGDNITVILLMKEKNDG